MDENVAGDMINVQEKINKAVNVVNLQLISPYEQLKINKKSKFIFHIKRLFIRTSKLTASKRKKVHIKNVQLIKKE